MKLGRVVVDGEVVAAEEDGALVHLLDGDPFVAPSRTGRSLPSAGVVFDSPCVPRHVFCVLLGWEPVDGSPVPPGPLPRVVPKVVTRVTGDGADIVLPSFLTEGVWIEPELAVVIGREVRAADRDAAEEAIFGFTVFNDVTALEHFEARDYFRMKCIDTFASMGPWISSDISEADVKAGLEIRCRINGVTRLQARTSGLRFRPSEVVSAVSMCTTLYPGDVIPLGSPPPMPPVAGPDDLVEMEIDGIGLLTNHVIAGR